MTKVGVVDDDDVIQEMVKAALDGFDVLEARTAEAGLRLVDEEALDVVLLDIGLPDASGLEAIRSIHGVDPKLPVVVITGEGAGDVAIEALKLGAYDFLVKPLSLATLRDVVDSAADARRKMHSAVALGGRESAAAIGDALIGQCREMIGVFKSIARCAPQNVPVLIRGESGTGKELVARAIYQHGARSDRPFHAVNCATLNENLLESELFGHEKGAFTGADRRRIGKFEQFDGGTIFLDEVGDMPLEVQAKMLRLLQDQEFERLGGSETISTDVRIISATNRDLDGMSEEGTFRLDLWHRLSGYEVSLPPLRDRGDDVPLLIEHFVARVSAELDIGGFEGVAPDALELLLAHDWPGNVRELESTIRQAMIDLDGPVLISSTLPQELAASKESSTGASAPGLDAFVRARLAHSDDLYAETIEFVERRLLAIVLAATGGNQSRAAEILGITRGKLRGRIREFEIDLDDVRDEVSGA